MGFEVFTTCCFGHVKRAKGKSFNSSKQHAEGEKNALKGGGMPIGAPLVFLNNKGESERN